MPRWNEFKLSNTNGQKYQLRLDKMANVLSVCLVPSGERELLNGAIRQTESAN